MLTKYLKIDKENPDRGMLLEAAEMIKQGGLVAFPTETVYGLGANGLNEQAVAKIYQAKGRPSDNPLILHIADPEDIYQLGTAISPNAIALSRKFWPGPLTVIVNRQQIVPDRVTGGLDTVAIRLPVSKVTRELIRLSGVPLAGPSANTSGKPSPTTAEAVMADLNGKIDAVLDAGPCSIGVESTVIDCTTPIPTILRPGGITPNMVRELLGEVDIDPALAGGAVKPKAPGMKYRHYAPEAPVLLFEGDPKKVEAALLSKVLISLLEGKAVGALVSLETAKLLPAKIELEIYGSRERPREVAANLFAKLRSFDTKKVDIIYAEGILEEGIGIAVMNRLRKAAGQHIIKI